MVRFLGIFFGFFSVNTNKKRRPAGLLFRAFKVETYFTMNFMVFSKPLAFTVTK